MDQQSARASLTTLGEDLTDWCLCYSCSRLSLTWRLVYNFWGQTKKRKESNNKFSAPKYFSQAVIFLSKGLFTGLFESISRKSAIAGRNTNNLRYADNTTLMAEGEEELKSLLMKVKEESGKSCEGTQGFLPQPGKDLERPSSTRLEARFPYHGSGAQTGSK